MQGDKQGWSREEITEGLLEIKKRDIKSLI
jgi:hypothetical protein